MKVGELDKTKCSAKFKSHKELIIKIKMYIDDIAALVHQSNKIRCQKFEVLEIVEKN